MDPYVRVVDGAEVLVNNEEAALWTEGHRSALYSVERLSPGIRWKRIAALKLNRSARVTGEREW